jgi:hypothetical protein
VKDKMAGVKGRSGIYLRTDKMRENMSKAQTGHKRTRKYI